MKSCDDSALLSRCVLPFYHYLVEIVFEFHLNPLYERNGMIELVGSFYPLHFSANSFEKDSYKRNEMEVTRSNFASVLSEMLAAVSSATFVSFDGEFTGLSAGGDALTALDSPKMRYRKLKQSQAVDFLLLQV